MKRIIACSICLLCAQAIYCQKKNTFGTNDYIRALKNSTDVMINDVTSPVAAARYYAYICLAANETFRIFEKQQPHFSGAIRGFDEVKIDQQLIDKSDQSFAVILALLKAGTRLLPSGYLLKNKADSLMLVAKKEKLPEQKIKHTSDLVDSVLNHVMKYVGMDGFSKLSGFRRFTPKTGDAYWQPTAPGFMAPVEPYWYTLRTFILDSCTQFTGGAPDNYDTSTSSGFYKQMKEVYDIKNNLTKEQADIAMFWDCNPFALQQVGHLEFGIKKISPGGHWMEITGIACKKQKLNLGKTVYAHAIVSLGMCDAFISCWNNKYKFNRVRPVTAIKKLIDREWSPLLQTPPFPEYTSGHSVISTASATILTHLFGDHFAFTDDSEKEFGLPVRKFSSFKDACREAAISRLYGGIHFRDAIDNGVKEGEQIGNFVVMKSVSLLAAQ
ncbi:MAG TPA: vanadium-dependent haloperoxidase [Flavitalea sp.]|nr:vanadium-dependent haloperoxidase [Flavitalea sp.]